MEKLFNIQHNIGRVKYVLNFHDGIQTHKDGSPFWGIFTFSNKKLLNNKIKQLKKEGYREV